MANITATARAINAVADDPKSPWRPEIVSAPITPADWPIHIMTPVMGTEMTPLAMALHTSALIGPSSKTLVTVPMPVTADDQKRLLLCDIPLVSAA